MARKLTGQERIDAEALRDALVEALPPSERGYAPGIASALVRLPGPQVSTADVARILTKYKVDQGAIRSMEEAQLLLPVDGEDGLFELNVPSGEADGAVTDDAATDDAVSEGSAMTDAPADGQASDADSSSDEPVEKKVMGQVDGGEKDSGSSSIQGTAEGDSTGSDPESAASSQEDAPVASDDQNTTPDQSKREGARTRRRSRSGRGRRQQAQPKADEKPADKPADQSETDKPASSTSEKSAAQKPDAPGAASSDAAASSEPAPKPSPAPKSDSPAPNPAGKPKSSPKPSPRHDPKRDLKKVPYVRRGSEADAEIRKKIVSLDQRFWMNGWLLSHPGAYTLYERELTAINDVLTDGMLPGDITRRQLAYQMGGDEKFFEYGSDGFKLLRAMGMEDVIRHRPTPKPDLVYHAPRRRKHMRVLVTENLDPYLDVHDLMYEDGRTQILGERIHAVVLGGGTPVLEHNRLALLLDTLGADTVEVLYWGDIDRAGVDLMMKLKDVLGEKYKFSPFAPAYQLMVERAMERFPDPEDNESTGQCNIDVPDTSLLCAGLTDEAAAYARAVIDACGLIPQEILTKRDL